MEPDMADDDHSLPAPVAEMSAAMRDATERARSYAAQWIDQRNRMATAVDEYRSSRMRSISDLPAADVPGVRDK
jgi:hypothetical protein